MAKVVHVAVGAIVKDGCVLLAKRAAHQHQGGLWEFPGGKVEAHEDVLAALARELQEELAISPIQASPLIQISHQYADKAVLLDVWQVNAFDGEPRGVEGQPIQWVPIEQLHTFEFPAANKPIVSALMLPNLIAITPSHGDLPQLHAFVESAIAKGADSIHIRAPQLKLDQAWQLYRYARQRLNRANGICWLNSGHVLADNGQCLLSDEQLAEVSAIHWKQAHRHYKAELPTEWASTACHSASDLSAAAELCFDCATLSPVQKTATHPDAIPLGWQQFTQSVAIATLPVYALGGLALTDLPAAKQAFAQGIAGISLFEAN